MTEQVPFHFRAVRQCAGACAALAATVALLVGCSGADPNKGEVTGTVTVDGQPAKVGSIAFIPADGNAPTAGGPIADGKYTATVPIGVAKVQVHVSKVVGQQKLYDTPDSPMRPIMEEALPAKYNEQTELTYEVKSGPNEKNFDLSTK